MSNEIRKIHLIPYSHHDYAWCNTRKWHIYRYIRAFDGYLQKMREDPEMTLTVDNIDHSVGEFEKYCPGSLDLFKEMVKSGRICVSNGGMALIRPALFDGEMIIRNAVDGMSKFCSLFDMTPEEMPTFWAADVGPGCTQIPQIMRQLGVRMYRFKRSEAVMNLNGVPEVFHWKGADGSTVIVERTSYSAPWRETFAGLTEETEEEMCARFETEHLQPREKRINTDEIIVPFGCDDALPMMNYFDQPIHIRELMRAWNDKRGGQMVFSTPNRFLEAVEHTPLPTWEGVIDPCELSFNAPFRADHSLWRARFRAERALLLCERLNAILAGIGGAPIDPEEIAGLWRRTYEFCGHAMQFLLGEDYTRVLASADATVTLLDEKCAELEEKIAMLAGTGKRNRHVLINPCSFDFDGLAELHITSERQVEGLRLFNADGNELPWQLTKIYDYMPGTPGSRPGQYSEVRVVCPIHIPANGYETVFVSFDGNRMPDLVVEKADMFEINAGKLRVTLDKGVITKVKLNGKTLLNEKPLLHLRFVSTKPTTSWYTDFESTGETAFVPSASEITLNGPLRWEILTQGKVGQSPARLVTVIERDNPEIAFRLELDNREKEGYFIADFPCDEDPELFAGVPFGEESRDTAKITYTQRDPNAKMSFLDFERGWKGQIWANGYLRMKLEGEDAALMQGDCDVYYQNIPHSGRVSLLLMKSIDLEARVDRWVRNMSEDTTGVGPQHFKFGFCFAEKDPTCRFKAVAERFRLPVLDVDRYSLEEGEAPFRFSLFSVSVCHVRVSSVENVEGGIRVRLYETTGTADDCTLSVHSAIRRAYFTDLLGRPIGKEAEILPDGIRFAIRPWEIATILIRK